MNVHAMICELNPLHNGHLAVIGQMRRDDGDAVILLVMSGNFTQRAGAALFDKYARARSALECGADIVVELPFPFSSAGAEFFGRAGVCIAEGVGATQLYFGSECGDIEALRRLARIMDSARYRAVCEQIRRADPTLGAAAMRDRALRRLVPGYGEDCASGSVAGYADGLGAPKLASVPGAECEGESLASSLTASYSAGGTGGGIAPDFAFGRAERPNDTLAVEYIRSARIPCVAVKRIGTASASAIREMTVSEAAEFVPDAVLDMMARSARSDAATLRRILWESLRLRRDTSTGLAMIAECGGGLGDRLCRIARESTNAGDFFASAATKRYTNSRIMRAALFALLGVTAQDLAAAPQYAVLLAASARGRKYLAARRRSEHVMPIVTKPADADSVFAALPAEAAEKTRRLTSLRRAADELYTLTLDMPLEADHFMRCHPHMG